MKLLIFIMIFASGCSIKPVHWNSCLKACEINGGIDEVDRTGAHLSCLCENTAVFTFLKNYGKWTRK